MYLYILIYLMVLVFSNKIQPKKWKVIDYFVLSLLIFLSGLRYMIGTDYELYERMFNSLTLSTVNDSRTGLGYNLMALQFKNIGLSFQSLIFFCSIITNVFIYSFLKKYSKKPGLSILGYLALGFYTFSFNGFRQAFSMSIFLFGYTKLREKNSFLMILSYFISFFIHSISGLGILLSIILELKPTIQIQIKKHLLIIFVVYILFDKIFEIVVSSSVGYNYYLNSTEEYVAGAGTLLRILQYLLLYYLFYYLYKKKGTEKEKNNSTEEKIAKIGIIVMLFAVKNWLIYRLSLQFLVFNCLFIDRIYYLNLVSIKRLQLLTFHTMLFMCYLLNIVSYDGVFPYRGLIGF